MEVVLEVVSEVVSATPGLGWALLPQGPLLPQKWAMPRAPSRLVEPQLPLPNQPVRLVRAPWSAQELLSVQPPWSGRPPLVRVPQSGRPPHLKARLWSQMRFAPDRV